MLELYTDATPNGLKISICLEELGLQYNVHRVFLGGEQKTPEFTALNPNSKIPVLVDDDFVLTESGAILIYLAEKTGKLLPKEPKPRAKVVEAVMFQMASLGPMFGQLLVFAGAWKNEYPQVTGRYVKEVNRILAVLETSFRGRPTSLATNSPFPTSLCFPGFEPPSPNLSARCSKSATSATCTPGGSACRPGRR
jgi:GST-like protein